MAKVPQLDDKIRFLIGGTPDKRFEPHFNVVHDILVRIGHNAKAEGWQSFALPRKAGQGKDHSACRPSRGTNKISSIHSVDNMV
jgi:hypothetical protein